MGFTLFTWFSSGLERVSGVWSVFEGFRGQGGLVMFGGVCRGLERLRGV